MATMFKLAIRSARSHLGRLALTALSVALAVSFWAGTAITSATFNKTFAGLVTDVFAGVDLVVRPDQGFEIDGGGDAETPLPDTLVETVRSIPGVTAVQPWSFKPVRVATAAGQTTTGKPTTTDGSLETWRTETKLRPYTIVEGREPTAPAEVAVDRGWAKKSKVALGNSVTLTNPDGTQTTASVIGFITFGSAESLPGGVTVLGTADWVRASTNTTGVYDRIWMTTQGTDLAATQRAVKDKIGDKAEVITGQKLRDDNKSSIGSAINTLKSVLTGFAIVALLVGSFLIANTFAMLVTQRSREIALLRAIGATQRQVRRSVLLEAMMVGLIASGIGLAIGVGIAKLLIGLLKSVLIDVDTPSLAITPGTIATALLIGVIVTVVSAWLPTRRATKIPPIAALRQNAIETPTVVSLRRILAGAVPTAAGIALIVAGSGSTPKFALAAAGGGLLVLGSVLLSPLLSRPALGLLGAIIPGRSTASRLADENVRRNPRRSASTANALLIGLTLVTGFTVIAASVQQSIGGGAKRQFAAAEALITSGDGGLDDTVLARVAAAPGVKRVGGYVFGAFKRNGSVTALTGVDTKLDGVMNLDLRDNVTLSALGPDRIFVYKNQYKDGVRVGDTIAMEFAETGKKDFIVAGIFNNNSVMPGDYVISLDAYRANFVSKAVTFAVIDAETPTAATAAGKAATAGTGATVQTIDEVVKDLRKQINTLLSVVIGLLAVALVIALMGIVNTMALSVLERTREIGLLRAVGMTRSQVRSTIRREAILITLYGVIFGLVLGSVVGWAIARTMATLGVDQVAFAPARLATYAIVGIVAGIAAAALPARRSARLDVLAALRHT
jgi:putative ABC transport system permease protein